MPVPELHKWLKKKYPRLWRKVIFTKDGHAYVIGDWCGELRLAVMEFYDART